MCCDISIFASMPNKNLRICESCCQSYQQIKSRWSIPYLSGLTIICPGFEGYRKPLYLGEPWFFVFHLHQSIDTAWYGKNQEKWLPCGSAAIRTCGAWAWLWLGRLESFWNMRAFNRWAACLRSAGISRMWHGVANVFGGHRCGTTWYDYVQLVQTNGYTMIHMDKEWQGSFVWFQYDQVTLRKWGNGWSVLEVSPDASHRSDKSLGEVLHDVDVLSSISTVWMSASIYTLTI